MELGLADESQITTIWPCGFGILAAKHRFYVIF